MNYVMSDIHGNSRRFNSVLKQIRLQPEDTLYVLGDVIDRYPAGIILLRKLMGMPNVKMILGNHEYMMLNAVDKDGLEKSEYEHNLRLWYRNGGEVTHNYLKHIRKVIRKEVYDYLHHLPLNIDVVVNGIPFRLIHGGALSRYPEQQYKYNILIQLCPHEGRHGVDKNLMRLNLIFQRCGGSGAFHASAFARRSQHQQIAVPDTCGI